MAQTWRLHERLPRPRSPRAPRRRRLHGRLVRKRRPHPHLRPWTIATREAGWRLLDEATLVTGSADPNAAAALATLTLGRVTGLQPLSKFDLAFRCAPRWMVEFYALSPTTTEICTIAGPGLHATYTVADSLVIARAN